MSACPGEVGEWKGDVHNDTNVCGMLSSGDAIEHCPLKMPMAKNEEKRLMDSLA
jgi:hypothetical protein